MTETEYARLVGGPELARAMGFTTTDAMRTAWKRKTLPVFVFRLPGRRGLFATSKDLQAWIATLAKERQR